MKTNYYLGETITVREPEDPRMSRNGGDYYFYETPILNEMGEKVGIIYGTSADFTYCQADGDFTDTVCAFCQELGQNFSVREQYVNENGTVDIDVFLF